MSADSPDPIDDLIGAILDGRDVDWDVEQVSLPADDRGMLESLRVLAAVASLQRVSVGAPSPADSAARFTRGPRIGGGAFGEVYQAWDTRLRRDVALKVVRLDLPFAASILSEARRLARVRHPNVVVIHDVYEDGQEGGICMELLSGHTLDAVLRARGPLTSTRVIELGVTLCEALQAVHDAGVVHGDVKAHNVLVEDSGRVVLMDFGAGVELTQPESPPRQGTPHYMSPELRRGGAPSRESDIFSLGMLLHYVATGTFPASGAQAAELHSSPALMSPLREVVDRAIRSQPARRFRSAADLRTSLLRSTTAPPYVLLLLCACVTALCVGAWRIRTSEAIAPPASAGIVDRQLNMPERLGGVGGLSSDGTLMAFRTADGGVGVLDTQSMQERVLVPGQATGNVIDGAFIRGSERAVLWAAENSTCKCLELRQASLAGGPPRVISRTRFSDLELVDLRRDGAFVLARAPAAGDPAELVLIHVATGKDTVVLKPPESAQFPRLSPDGRFIVYSAASEASDVGGDIFVADTETGTTSPLLAGPADDRTPLWTDEGSVLFASNRAGGYGLWLQKVVDGRPHGEPVLIERDMGRFIPLYVAGDHLTYWRSPVLDIELAPFDPDTGKVTGQTRMLPARVSGANTAPSWSSDGKMIAYASERRSLGPARSVVVLSTTAGLERELTVPVNGSLDPVLSSGGDRLLIRGPGTFDGVRGGRIVDLASEKIVLTLPYPIGASHQWGRDGREIYFLDPKNQIQRVDVATGRKTPLEVEGGWVAWSIALSRDGRVIAASAASKGRRAIILVPVDGGTPSIVYEPGAKSPIPMVWDWTPDDRHLLAVLNSPNEGQWLRQLVTISVADGRMMDSGLKREALDWVRLRPDGRELAYRIGRNARTLWQRSGLLRPR